MNNSLRQFAGVAPLQAVDTGDPDTDLFSQNLRPSDEGLFRLLVFVALGTPQAVNLVQRRPSGNTKATGSITVVEGEKLEDEDNFTLDDGVNPPVVFEYDDDGETDDGDAYAIPFTAARTAQFMRDETLRVIREAIAAEDLDMAAEPHPTNPAVILLTSLTDTVDANAAILEDVTHADFQVDGMDGWAEDGEVAFALAPAHDEEETPAEQGQALEALIHSGFEYNLQLAAGGLVQSLVVGYKRA